MGLIPATDVAINAKRQRSRNRKNCYRANADVIEEKSGSESIMSFTNVKNVDICLTVIPTMLLFAKAGITKCEH